MKFRAFFFVFIFSVIGCITSPGLSVAEELGSLSSGQLLYVPAYSHIYHGNKENKFFMAVTLSVRNIDPNASITLQKVDYHETAGGKLTNYLNKPVVLGPLASVRYVVSEKDKTGGSGANFIVKWTADTAVNAPIVETVMIGVYSSHGIAFTSRAREILPKKK